VKKARLETPNGVTHAHPVGATSGAHLEEPGATDCRWHEFHGAKSTPIRPSVENARELVSKDEGNRNPAAARIQRRHSQRLGYSCRVDVAGQCFLSISETVIHSMKLEKQITLYPWRILLLAMTCSLIEYLSAKILSTHEVS